MHETAQAAGIRDMLAASDRTHRDLFWKKNKQGEPLHTMVDGVCITCRAAYEQLVAVEEAVCQQQP